MPSIKTPYMPIEEFDVEKVIENAKSIEEDESQHINLEEVLADLPITATEAGRDSFTRDVALILHGMGMEKYMDLFKNEDISLETFLQLNYDDLNQLGITDSDDQNTIIQNLKGLKPESVVPADEKHIRTFYSPPYNPFHEYVMVKNVHNHLVFLLSYCSYTILQLRKNPMYDYFISRHQTAAMILKLLTRQAVLQSNRIKDILYNGGLEGDNLITSAMKINNKELSDCFMKKLKAQKPKKKLKRKRVILAIIGGIGISSFAVLIGRLFIQR